MPKKVDLVMWTKNGAKTLPQVLKRIENVIPSERVHNRIIVDDKSVDETREIGESFGWQIIPNKGSGISDGANTAFENVESEYFVSFEQDLFLAQDWWQKIPQYVLSKKFQIASGIRLPNQPPDLKKLHEYAAERIQKKEGTIDSFLNGKSLDNTMYTTEVVKQLGGFPKLPFSAGVDNVLALEAHKNGFLWKVDYNVRSIHLRSGLREELKHNYWYGVCFNPLLPIISGKNVAIYPQILRLLFSPVRGLEIALKKNAPQVVYVYPLTRLAIVRGIFAGRKRRTVC